MMKLALAFICVCLLGCFVGRTVAQCPENTAQIFAPNGLSSPCIVQQLELNARCEGRVLGGTSHAVGTCVIHSNANRLICCGHTAPSPPNSASSGASSRSTQHSPLFTGNIHSAHPPFTPHTAASTSSDVSLGQFPFLIQQFPAPPTHLPAHPNAHVHQPQQHQGHDGGSLSLGTGSSSSSRNSHQHAPSDVPLTANSWHISNESPAIPPSSSGSGLSLFRDDHPRAAALNSPYSGRSTSQLRVASARRSRGHRLNPIQTHTLTPQQAHHRVPQSARRHAEADTNPRRFGHHDPPSPGEPTPNHNVDPWSHVPQDQHHQQQQPHEQKPKKDGPSTSR